MSETLTKELTRDDAQTALNIALEAKQGAQTALNNFITEKREVEKDIANAKAILMERDAQVLLARAALARFGPLPRANSGASINHNEVREAVLKMLGEAGSEGMATDDIFNRLQDNGVSMGGEKPRQNLNAYLSRWASAGTIAKLGRGLYTAKQVEQLPAFLAPPKAEEPSSEQTQDESEEALPSTFPHLDALTEAGYTTYESIEGKTRDQLRRIKGVGAAGADAILAALEPVEA